MKNDLPYFSHDNDARNHPKMKALRARYGWTGYGQFWALNEMIAGAAEAKLDLSRKVVRAAVACELGMTIDALDDFLTFLANSDECGLIHYASGIVTTDRTREDYAKTEEGRASARARYEKKRPTSPENYKTSGENWETSGEKTYRAEQSRAEEKKEQPRARDTGVVDNSETERFEAWALARAKKAGARNPTAYARTILADPKALEEFRRDMPEPDTFFAPVPPTCTCGGTIVSLGHLGGGQCSNCGAWWTYDRKSGEWLCEKNDGG